MTQLAIFPMKFMNLTQRWGSGTHQYGYPIDIAGKDGSIDDCYAPFDGVIKKKYENGHSVWLESLAPVQFADGTVDYAVVMFTHDNVITDLSVGQVIRQGQIFYQEGTAGRATGNHIHLECGRGRYRPEGWYQAPNGQWVINNPVPPNGLLWLSDDIRVIETLGLEFKKEDNMKPTVQQVNDIFTLYLGHPPKDEAERQFYLNRDIRELYWNVLQSQRPSLDEVKQAFADAGVPLDQAPYTDQSKYYPARSRWMLYKDLFAGVVARLKAEKSPVEPKPLEPGIYQVK